MSMKTIEVKALAELMKKDAGIELIDVRMPAEYETVHATGARLAPLDGLQPKQVMAARNGKAAAPLYVILQKRACVPPKPARSSLPKALIVL